ncbi:MAG: M1 family metallopeptidase, partial [Clostridia bacterium]|nr:M1 family metallopeptidase [Clostridia bacterium]
GGEDMNILYVPLNAELFPNERVAIEIDFATDIARVIARTGVNDDTVNLANFYPVLCGIESGGFYECVYYSSGDPFFSEASDYTVNFTRDKKYTAAASGETVSEKIYGDKIISRYKINNARSFALVLSEKFKVISEKSGDTEILYYYYSDETPDLSALCAKQALEFFGDKWGEYPYKTYSVVQTPFIQGGMEFTALTYIGAELESAAYKEVIVHETAHQWWQTVVGNNEIKHPFIDEGLAEYSVVLFYEAHPDYGRTRENLIKSAEQTYKLYCSVYEKITGSTDTTMTRAIPEYTSEYEYVNISYVKACIMFDYLRRTVGDGKFFAGLNRFYDENAYKIATPESLVGAFERAGANSNGFFESFFDGKVII